VAVKNGANIFRLHFVYPSDAEILSLGIVRACKLEPAMSNELIIAVKNEA